MSELHQQHLRRSFKSTSELKVVLGNLEELGYVRRIEEPEREGRGRGPSSTYKMNPLGCTEKSVCTTNSPDSANLQYIKRLQYRDSGMDSDLEPIRKLLTPEM